MFESGVWKKHICYNASIFFSNVYLASNSIMLSIIDTICFSECVNNDFSILSDTCDSYCLVTLHHPLRTKGSGHSSPKVLSPKLSPKTGPKLSPVSTPPGSPRLLRVDSGPLKSATQGHGAKGSFSAESEVHRTSTIKSSSHPKWNEEFTL